MDPWAIRYLPRPSGYGILRLPYVAHIRAYEGRWVAERNGQVWSSHACLWPLLQQLQGYAALFKTDMESELRLNAVYALAVQMIVPINADDETSLSLENEAREFFWKGLSPEQALCEMRRRARAREPKYPDLHAFMPTLEELSVASADPLLRVVRHAEFPTLRRMEPWFPRPTYQTRLGGWKRQSWWSFVRCLTIRRERMQVARVYLNGGGRDHELRFIVNFPRDAHDRWGAANDFCRLDDRYPARLRRNTGARGLSYPTKEDVLEVMAWCDGKLDELIAPWKAEGVAR